MKALRPLSLLLTANAISVTGTAMTLLAVPWFVLVTTHSAGRTGIAAASETLPLVLASALGGPLVDHLGPRRTAIGSDLLSALGIALVPVLHLTIGLAFWQLCAVVACVGLVRAPGDTARSVLLPKLAEAGGTSLERAAGSYDGVNRGARMLGAPLAGALIAGIGPAEVMLVDAVSFLTSALLLSAIPAVQAVREHREPYLRELRGGLAALRSDRLLLGITLMVMVTNMLDAASGSVLAPVYAREVLHSSTALGFLYAAFGIGALIGNAGYATWGVRFPRWSVFTVAFLLVGFPRFALMAGYPPYPLLLAAQVVFGIACGGINPMLTAVELERIPEALRSRVLGVMAAGVLAGMPVGAALAGFAISHLGLRSALLLTGLVYLAATISPVVWRRTWRQMDATRSGAGDLDLDEDLHDIAHLQGAQSL